MNEASIYAKALEQMPEHRSKFLDEVCGEDSEVRARIEALLRDEGSEPETDRSCDAVQRDFDDETIGNSEVGDSGCFVGDQRNGSAVDRRSVREKVTREDLTTLNLRLTGYEILEVIGRGGGGVVLKATEQRLNRLVALKVLAPEIQEQPTALRRFIREARAVAAVAHENVVNIFTVDETSKPPMLVMEYVDGPSLHSKVKRSGALDVREVLRIGIEIASGLSAAHRQGLIHRDIKPSNVLLSGPEERAKLTDFGLARAVDDVDLTKTGQVFGTPLYMSPEQASGKRVDYRSDIFSLGSVLYTMCAGRPAFSAETGVAVAHRVIHDDADPIDDVNPQIPGWLCAIVERCIEKDPSDRFESVEEIAGLLRRHLEHHDHPSSAPKPATTERRTRSVTQEADKRLRQIGREMILLGAVSVAWGLVGLLIYRPTFNSLFVSLYLSIIAGMLGAFGGYHVLKRQSQRIALVGSLALMMPVNPFQLLAIWSTFHIASDLRSDRLKPWFQPHSLWELMKLPAAFVFAAVSLYILAVVVLQTMLPESEVSRIRNIEVDGGTTIIYMDR